MYTTSIATPRGLILKRGKMKRVNFYLTEYQIKKLKQLSKEIDLSVSEIIRRMIDTELGKKEKTNV